MRRSLLPAALFLLGSASLHAQQRTLDVQRYRFEVTLPDRGRSIRVAASVTAERGDGVDSLRLDLLAPMKVSAATLGCGAAAASVPFTHDGKVIAVPLPALKSSGRMLQAQPVAVPAPALDTVCVTVRYEGEPADGLVISTDSAGRWRAFGDNWPDRARHWLASVDHPSDKAIVEFVVEAPAALTIVSNGTQRAQVDVPGRTPRRRTTWETAAPVPTYLMVIAAAPLVARELGETACGLGSVQRCVPQRVFTAPEQARYLPGHFVEADSIVSFFARTVGPFPYEQLAHLQSSTRFGGMENAGAIFYADRLFRSQDGLAVSLIAHETAHQWFGDAVTEREWGHLWLSEGFATYFAALYTEHSQGDSAFHADLARMKKSVFDSPVAAERPVLDTAQSDLLALLNANSYQKGGMVLHMLRREVGDSAFFRGVRSYWTTNRHGNGTTAALEQSVEREAGRDLAWFFDQWLRRPGWAELQVTWAYDAAKAQLDLTVTQGVRFAPYALKLPVSIIMADGTRREAIAYVPPQQEATVAVRIRLEAAPASVLLDPRGDLLATIRTP